MGLLDNPDTLQQLGMSFGLLNAKRGDNWPQLFIQAAQQKNLAQAQERQNRASDLQQVVATYKILKDQDQQARDNAMFTGQPYTPDPLLAQHEAKLAQLMGSQPMTGSMPGHMPPAMSAMSPPQRPPMMPQGQQQTPQQAPQSFGQSAQMPQQPAQAPQQPTSIQEMLQGAGIDPRMAASWAQTPAGKNELYKKLADVYGPRVVNNVLMQLQPNGQTKFLGGAVGNDTLPVVNGPNGLQVQPINGLIDARVAQKKAETEAVKGVEANYTPLTLPLPNGSSTVTTVGRFVGQQQPQQPGAASLSVTQPPRAGSGAGFGMSQTPADRAQSEDLAKFHAQTFIDTQQAAKAAQKGMLNLDRIDQLMQGVDTGKLTPTGMQIAAYGQALGIPLDPKLPNKQAAEALTGQIALELRNPSGGAGMPGALSDNDLKFLRSMTPGLAQTTDGRKMIIDTKRKLLQRDQEIAQLARDYRKRNGGRVDDGFSQALADYSSSHPLFPQATAQAGWSIQEVK